MSVANRRRRIGLCWPRHLGRDQLSWPRAAPSSAVAEVTRSPPTVRPSRGLFVCGSPEQFGLVGREGALAVSWWCSARTPGGGNPARTCSLEPAHTAAGKTGIQRL